MLEVTLPWPPRELSPNARNHWTAKAEASQTAKAQGCYLTMEIFNSPYGYPCSWAKKGTGNMIFQATYVFHPPDKRKRDIDNFLAMMKNYQDGVCAALGIDDSRIKRTVIEWGAVVKGGKVVLRLEEICQSS